MAGAVVKEVEGMRVWIVLAGLNGAMAIGFAAYGAHGLPPDPAALVERASQFQLLHAAALLALIGLLDGRRPLITLAGVLMVAGVAAFSGSLYLKALGLSLPVPMVTPAGGVTLLTSWLVLAVAGIVERRV